MSMSRSIILTTLIAAVAPDEENEPPRDAANKPAANKAAAKPAAKPANKAAAKPTSKAAGKNLTGFSWKEEVIGGAAFSPSDAKLTRKADAAPDKRERVVAAEPARTGVRGVRESGESGSPVWVELKPGFREGRTLMRGLHAADSAGGGSEVGSPGGEFGCAPLIRLLRTVPCAVPESVARRTLSDAN
ncbi:hypothetical protein T492DRAFT_846917 [Pavlovales sp. CCMP2436]|nr:hypothetical protein T492DRAFT_846917 [Pavlovales sp. CCMP2436]